MDILLTLGGAALLMICGDALVRGAIGLSLRVGLSATLIGLTVVAFGTSAPELVISIKAALDGSPDIALGNVVGSNIANILLILGVPALLVSLGSGTRELRLNYGMMLAVTALFCAIAYTGRIGRSDGAILLVALVAAMAFSYFKARETVEEIPEDAVHMPGWMMAGLLAVGVIGLPAGAHMMIEGARGIALAFGISEAAVGLTVVALGTSLPELAASTAAAFRGRNDVALANVIGSNILNLLLVIGATAVIAPLGVSSRFLTVDIPVMAVVAVVLAPFLIWKVPLSRTAGIGFLLMYCAFVYFVLGDVPK